MRKTETEKLYTLSALADASGFRLRTIQKHVEKGAIRVRRVGPYKRPRIPESEFRKYLGEKGE